MNSLYHRLPLIHPGLQAIGVWAAGQYSCLYFRAGTSHVPAPHPILYPPPDRYGADRQFNGHEGPCPTVEDPDGVSFDDCPASGTIATIGNHGWGALRDVTASMRNLDSGQAVPMFRTYFDGGPSPHERIGAHLNGTIAFVPEVGLILDEALYEVTVEVGSLDETFRWRFHTGRIPLDGPGDCDTAGDISSFENARRVGAGSEVRDRVCTAPHVYRLTGVGSRHVSIEFVHARGNLDLVVFNSSEVQTTSSEGMGDMEEVMTSAGHFVQVVPAAGAENSYVLRVTN